MPLIGSGADHPRKVEPAWLLGSLTPTEFWFGEGNRLDVVWVWRTPVKNNWGIDSPRPDLSNPHNLPLYKID